MRLTTNENGIYVDYDCIIPQTNDIIDKLGQLEDIEDELGIDLITLCKAIKNGIHVKPQKYKTIFGAFITPDHFRNSVLTITELIGGWAFVHTDRYKFPDENIVGEWFFKDYGKTWALTKEELEK